MSTGAERAAAQSETEWPAVEGGGGDSAEWTAPEDRETTRGGSRLLGGVLALLALAWIAACGWAVWLARPEPQVGPWVEWIATASAPLILLALVWLLFGRSSRRETERFLRAVAALRRESETLDGVLAITGQRIEENRARVSEEAARLMSLGEEASDRLGRVTHYLAQGSEDLDRKAQALENAAQNARVDLGVLMTDLPRAEEQARSVAEAMKDAGLGALERAGALESQLSALLARGREADEVASGAAQRLGAQLARIESSAGAAGERIETAGTQMNAAIDGAMARASDAVEEARAAVASQGEATLAMIAQGRAAFEEAGAEASRRLAERLERVGSTIEELASRLAAQDAATQTLLAGLAVQVGELEERIAAVGRTGDAAGAELARTVEDVRASVRQLGEEIEAGRDQAGDLIGTTREMTEAISGVARQLRDELGSALDDTESRAARVRETAAGAVEPVEAVQAAAVIAAGSLAESEAAVARQRGALDALLATLREGIGDAEQRLRSLGGQIGETDATAARLAQQTGPELIEALVRVRETAAQAAAHAREAIGAVIPESAAALAEASRTAVSEAVSAPVRDQLQALAEVSEAAVEAARSASERLTRQLLVIGRSAAAVEAKFAEDRAAREEAEAEGMTRRVSLLIEALNSTAIDVTKILSNEVTDSAWAAYLKGDRGVFTRRAVRLLDSGEAREILRHYEEEPEFREQVNRYVADFEALLGRVLADRDGHALAVTLLSSDMGKLYVALAQAIDRLRR